MNQPPHQDDPTGDPPKDPASPQEASPKEPASGEAAQVSPIPPKRAPGEQAPVTRIPPKRAPGEQAPVTPLPPKPKSDGKAPTTPDSSVTQPPGQSAPTAPITLPPAAPPPRSPQSSAPPPPPPRVGDPRIADPASTTGTYPAPPTVEQPAVGGFPPPQPPTAGPAAGGTPPARSNRRLGLWIGLGVGAFALLLVIALVIGLLVFMKSSDDADDGAALAPGDDTVHAAEIASIQRPQSRNLLPLPTAPRAKWTAGPGLSERAGDPSAIVVSPSEDARFLTVLDAATGRPRFSAPMPAGRFLDICATTGNRVACNAYAHGRPDLLVVWDARSGRELGRTRLPDGETIQYMYGSGDRFVIKRGGTLSEDIGTMYGIDLDGKLRWTQQGSFVLADQPVVVRIPGSSPALKQVEFLRVGDGSKITEYRSDTPRVNPWTAYDGGLAVLNSEGTATDFFDLDGTKTASLAGWHPAMGFSATDTAPPAPILGRTPETPWFNSFTIGAANPATGHVLWRKTGSEFFATRLDSAMIGDLLGIRVGEAGGSTTPVDGKDETNHDGPIQFFDPLTGAQLSARLPVAKQGSTGEVFTTDGSRLIASNFGDLIAYDLASGSEAWRYDGVSSTSSFLQLGQRIFDTGDGVALLAD